MANYYYTHGIILGIAWFVLLLIVMSSVRWFNGLYWNKTIVIHAIFGWIITGMTMGMGVTAIKKGGGFFSNGGYHHLVGQLYVLFVIPLAITGVISLILRKESSWNTKRILLSKQIHKVIGTIFVIASILQIAGGLQLYHENWRVDDDSFNLGPLYIPIAILLFSGFEIWYRYRRDVGVVELKLKDKFKGSVMTESEFEERVKKGEKLCILDDLVLDVTNYGDNHPGGAFLINFTVGRDVSKFFHGGHALDSNSNDPKAKTPKNTHSNLARMIACDLAIAIISKKRAADCIAFLDHNKTVHHNQHTATYTFKLIHQENKVKNHERVPIKSYYEEMEYLGKHYMVGATKDQLLDNDVQTTFNGQKVRRHYTISNCMQKNFYEMLLKAANTFLEGKDIDSVINSTTLDDHSFSETDQLCLTIKNYNVPNGISRQFSNSMLQKQAYEIKGPMGKGLGLTPASKGVHMAFSAGTGILVFVDLVARLLISSLEVIHESQRFHKDFQLHMYASFMSREEAIALELLEALEKVQKKKGLNQFKLILRLSKTNPPQEKKPPRWDEKYLDQQLADAVKSSGVGKIWACGPPLMDEQFDQILSKISKSHGVDFQT